jgi:UDP:flavonoid glycosyltransferase YjiC (YdhE family)
VVFAVPETILDAVRREGFPAMVTTSGAVTPLVAEVFAQMPAQADPITFIMREYWGNALVQEGLPPLQRIIESWQPDVVVSEVMDLAGPLAAEAAGLAYVPLGVNALQIGRVGLEVATEPVNELRRKIGLSAEADLSWVFRHLYVTPFPGFLEHPELMRPATTLTYRHQDPDGFTPGVHPGSRRAPGNRPTVYASLGTKATEDDGQLEAHRTVLAGLGQVDADVVFTVGGLDRASLGRLPENVRLATFLPPRVAMDTDVVLTHAGAGTTTAALSRGLPLVCVPLFGDQPHNAARVAALGAGVAVEPARAPTQAAAARSVTAAVNEVLGTPSYTAMARSLGAEMGREPTVDAVVDPLHSLVDGSGERMAVAGARGTVWGCRPS